MADNPFDKSDEFNPFAQTNVTTYNPFAQSSSSSAPRLVVNTSSPPSNREDPDDQPFGKVDDGFYDNHTPMQDMNGSSSDEEVYIAQPTSEMPLKATSTSASAGHRVHVTTSEEKPEDDAASMWSFEYYQQFFNIDSAEVMWRCLRSLWPFKLNFIQFVRTNPDFYGPFWITTTLIFMLAAGSNFATYLHNPAAWNYNFFTLTTGAGIIWGYAFGMPVLLWLYFKWVDLNVSLIEMLCIYGYSLFSYTPVAVLCIIPIMYVQWVVVIIACLISTSFLIVNMWAPLRSKVGHAVLVLIIMGCFHVALGLCVQLYWFQFYSQAPQPAPAPTVPVTPVPAPL